jgi:hypothetical protein
MSSVAPLSFVSLTPGDGDFPSRIRIKGLGFHLQGWNQILYRNGDMSDGCPVYKLDSYTLYFVIGIIGIRLLRINGIWRIQRDGDAVPTDLRQFGAGPQATPFMSDWTGGARVVAL